MSEEEKIEKLKRLLYTNTLTQYGKRKLINYYEKEIEKLQKENEELRETNKKLYETGLEISKQIYTPENYIPIQKVKDKIEELKKTRQKMDRRIVRTRQ